MSQDSYGEQRANKFFARRSTFSNSSSSLFSFHVPPCFTTRSFNQNFNFKSVEHDPAMHSNPSNEMFRPKNIVITGRTIVHTHTHTYMQPEPHERSQSRHPSPLRPQLTLTLIFSNILFTLLDFFVFRLSFLFRFGNTAADDIILDFLFLAPSTSLIRYAHASLSLS